METNGQNKGPLYLNLAITFGCIALLVPGQYLVGMIVRYFSIAGPPGSISEALMISYFLTAYTIIIMFLIFVAHSWWKKKYLPTLDPRTQGITAYANKMGKRIGLFVGFAGILIFVAKIYFK